MKFLAQVLLLSFALLWLGVPGLGAQPQFVSPWAPNLAPQWAPIPQVPGVYYVPGLGHDLFRHGNRFYVYQGGQWYRSKHLNGPWGAIKQPPGFLPYRTDLLPVAAGVGQGGKDRLAG